MNTAAKLLAAMMVASFSNYAMADCHCSCVNGQVEAVCASPSELPPVCAPRACTAKRVRASLLVDKTQMAANAKRECRQTEVLNPRTGSYITKQVCR